MDNKLRDVRDWAKSKIATGIEPPWAWYQYMKLIETVDAILGGEKTAIPMENSRQSDMRSETHLQLVDSKYQQDTSQSHPDDWRDKLPM
jgi:hypothetical protein